MSERDNPYVGLRPFFIDDSLFFFGREEQTAELLAILHEHRFLGIVGSSGSGKSSLVRAGLLPSLLGGFLVEDRDTWRLAQVRPGDAPMANLTDGLVEAFGNALTPEERDALETAIREDGVEAVRAFLCSRLDRTRESLFLLVDQFEEIFAFRRAAGSAATDDESPERTRERSRRQTEAADYVALLMGLSEQADLPIYVALTMRTDFLGDCDLFYGFPEILNKGQYLVPRLTRQQLRRAIEGPAKLQGARLSPRLLDHLLNELGDRSDRLPVLQHALQRTWDAWGGAEGPIDVEHFDAAGGLEGALNQDAERALAGLDEGIAARIFKRLTDTDLSQRAVRSPARMSELADAAGSDRAIVDGIVTRFRGDGRNFLYVSSDGNAADPRVDISHESLIRQWRRLRQWVEEERASRDRFRALAAQAQRWSESGLMEAWRRFRRPAADDPDARRWFARLTNLISAWTSQGRDDLLRGGVLRQYRRWKKQEQPTAGWAARYSAQRDDFVAALRFLRASVRYRRIRIVAPIVVVGIAAVWLAGSATEARRRQDERDAVLKSASALEVQVNQVKDPEVAIILGLYAVGKHRSIGGDPPDSLVNSLLRNWHDSAATETVVSRETGESLIGDEGVKAVMLSADGTSLAVQQGDHIKVWNVQFRSPYPTIGDATNKVVAACGAFIAKNTLAIVDRSKVLSVFDITTGKPSGAPRPVGRGDASAPFGCALSPDGRGLALLEFDREASAKANTNPDERDEDDGRWQFSLWSLDAANQPRRVGAPVTLNATFSYLPPFAGFSPDGAKLAVIDPTTYSARKVALFDAHTGRRDRLIDAPNGVSGVVFDHRHRQVAISAASPTGVSVWNLERGSRLDLATDPEAADRPYADLAFSPDDRRLVGVGYTATVWSAESGDRLRTFGGYEDSIWTAVFRTEHEVVTAGRDGHVKRWNADSPELVVAADLNDGSVPAFTPDFRQIAIAENDAVVVRDLDGGAEMRRLTTANEVTAVAVSGEWLVAAGSADGTVTVFDAGGKVRATFAGAVKEPVSQLTFSPDGRRLAAAKGAAVRVWRIGRQTASGHEPDAEVRTLVAPAETGESADDRGVFSLGFVGNAQDLAMTTNSGFTVVWNTDTGERKAPISTGWNTMTAATLPRRGELVTGDVDGRVQVWPLFRTGPSKLLKGHRSWVTGVAVSHDESRFATASNDKTAIVWDAQSKKPLLTLRHTVPVSSVAFSPEDDRVMTSGIDARGYGFIRVWEVPRQEHIIERAFQKITRPLTTAECVQFGLSPEGGRCPPDLQLSNLLPPSTQ